MSKALEGGIEASSLTIIVAREDWRCNGMLF
jgi:hypothetical protein